MLKGFKKLKPQKDTRLPITIDILARFPPVLSVVCSSNYEQILFKAAFYLAFFGLMRIAELVFNSSDSRKTLSCRDIVVVGDKLHVTIRHSKK